MHGMIPVIPKRANTKKSNPEFDSYLYKLRHLVEKMFARLKHFRSIATPMKSWLAILSLCFT